MPVGEGSQETAFPVQGVRLAAVAAGIRHANRLDLVLFEFSVGTNVAGVFTRNAFCAAPVLIARTHLQKSGIRYLLINTGNANAGTGEPGRLNSLLCCQKLAELADVDLHSVLPFSTGVIGQNLPVEKILLGIPEALKALKADRWLDAARGIMTTDTRPKMVSVTLEHQGKTLAITGIAKGAGMIKPNMATMLAFICTDARIDQPLLENLLSQAVNSSFNRITVDGDTSTNDSCIVAATGKSAVVVSAQDQLLLSSFSKALTTVMTGLATAIIRDAEGATKFVTVRVKNGRDSKECLAVAYAIAESPLVKTALFASDPNWGRILAAIGRAGVDELEIDKITIHLNEACLVTKGAVAADYTEAKGQAVMDLDEIEITVNLQRGEVCETVWTSDLSHEYVRINAEYRS